MARGARIHDRIPLVPVALVSIVGMAAFIEYSFLHISSIEFEGRPTSMR
jgi:hypothetical protein